MQTVDQASVKKVAKKSVKNLADKPAPIEAASAVLNKGQSLLFASPNAEQAIAAARSGRQESAALTLHQRYLILSQGAEQVLAHQDYLARLIVEESGKTIRQAHKEVDRCANTLLLSAEEAKRIGGELIPFSAYEGSADRMGYAQREPLGIILAITPFNDPLNLVAHKLGPAIAGGNSVILKPASLTPKTAAALVSLLLASGLPKNVITVFTGDRVAASELLALRDIRMVSFTGGPETGEQITRQAGLKKMLMDLGGNAPVLICEDADIEAAVAACVEGGFWAAGQNCIGVQRVLIDHSLFDDFCHRFLRLTAQLNVGDPHLTTTDMGPMVNEAAAKRIEAWVDEALQQGATLLCGHQRDGAYYQPTVLSDVPQTCKVWQEEVFAPLVILHSTASFEESIALANSLDYSLHAGIFTENLNAALSAAKRLEAGGVMINDSSDYRFDAMPFGGFKYGSMGREGVKSALEEMTQTKVVCFKQA